MTERGGDLQDAVEAGLEEVRGRIDEACRRAGRDPAGVELLPITKGQPLDKIRAAHELGIRRVGENRVGEALKKQGELADLDDLRWDMVGHIQSRKTKDVVPNFDRVHSLDRPKIARYLDRYGAENDKVMPVFVECNVSGEESKYGFELSDPGAWPAVLDEFRSIVGMRSLDVQGLMTMAPWTEDEEVLRAAFRKLRELQGFLQEKLPEGGWQGLSMGMTDDFEIAVEEGATLVRVGRAIFGSREG